MFNGALQRIREPDVLDPVDTGGQATVFRFSENSVTYAMRRVDLRTSEERLKFVERVNTLSSLRQRIRGREGSQYIYELDRIGLSASGEAGIEIYRWIDGVSLEEKRSKLPTRAVVEIGARLARGLQILHDENVIHRDIRPRNVILSDDNLRPVFVDFGLARLATSQMETVFADEMMAPEVRCSPPAWSKAADIYALGSTLKALANPKEKEFAKLGSAVERCCAYTSEQRPTARDLVEMLCEVESELRIQEKLEASWNAVAITASGDTGLHEVLRKFRPTLDGLALGLFPSAFERCGQVALFLDQVVESRGDGRTKLGSMKNEKNYNGVDLRSASVDFVHSLRLERAHWQDNRKRQQILRRYGEPNDSAMATMIADAANLLGRALEIGCLTATVAALLDVSNVSY
ncbi:MAG: protein kinase family protein [Gammaproteobacteria bacterium]|nr:protein kinase family protein [Gammaproteobacteria bacterium]